jgi:hypothetical protein
MSPYSGGFLCLYDMSTQNYIKVFFDQTQEIVHGINNDGRYQSRVGRVALTSESQSC